MKCNGRMTCGRRLPWPVLNTVPAFTSRERGRQRKPQSRKSTSGYRCKTRTSRVRTEQYVVTVTSEAEVSPVNSPILNTTWYGHCVHIPIIPQISTFRIRWDSTVGAMKTERSGINSRQGLGLGPFFYATTFRPALGLPRLLPNRYWKLFTGNKRLESKESQSSVCSAMLRTRGATSPLTLIIY
jgi:hypothetical protein